MKFHCSLCDQSFEKLDPDIRFRIKRHEARHNRKGKAFKDRNQGGGNNISGKVVWRESE